MKTIKFMLDKFLTYAISILLIVMTSLVLWQVFTRYILKNPSMFTEELVIIILVWTSLLGAAYAFGSREHMSLIFLKEKLKGTNKLIIYVFIDVVILLFAVFILIIGGTEITRAVAIIKTPILNISKAYIYSSTIVSGVLIVFYQIVNIFEDFRINDK
ncbi:TRAP transporter small permease [Clostridium lacusfryxellense]|uniref:TRAP transporter small permease n=1 Tax=Clostridium lacusfryxellense TaxID=205328 RepID=UPI001C0C90C9|nr:TRAP transporter small permease [Clostridium lacusfryxellense]MBU3113024.1 TRAP transporter small permease [Clostridium lacusfryxellense]